MSSNVGVIAILTGNVPNGSKINVPIMAYSATLTSVMTYKPANTPTIAATVSQGPNKAIIKPIVVPMTPIAKPLKPGSILSRWYAAVQVQP